MVEKKEKQTVDWITVAKCLYELDKMIAMMQKQRGESREPLTTFYDKILSELYAQKDKLITDNT